MDISVASINRYFRITISTMLLLSICSNSATAEANEFVRFDDYISTVSKSTAAQFKEHPLFNVVSEEEFKRMKNHILKTYYLVEVANSFDLPGSGHIDCINRATQPSLRRGDKFLTMAKSPQPLIIKDQGRDDKVNYVKPILDASKIDNFGNRMACSEGYIPMARIELEDMFRYLDLEGFFNKNGFAGSQGIPEADKQQER